MSKKAQTAKNFKLTYKLVKYLLRGKNAPKLPKDISFVPFSNNDEKLNKANYELLKNIKNDEIPVAKAEEPKSSKNSWIITPVNF